MSRAQISIERGLPKSAITLIVNQMTDDNPMKYIELSSTESGDIRCC